MTFREVVTELRARFPKAVMSPTASRGECYERACAADFKRNKNCTYVGLDGNGKEISLYLNESENLICCFEGGE
jgi:hypothetical protein